ncbi:hypothetical protein [Kocuria sp. cx-455]|uniref:hypothetical protein n=1 Tax=Kocuria sp. cx-455 TaxID=2771377 RepID=UPI003D751E08
MNTNINVPSFDLPDAADLKEWPDRELITAGFLPGPISHTREHDGQMLWVFGGLLFDTKERQIHAFSMKDATDLERTSVSQTQELYRRRYVYLTPDIPSAEETLAAKPWVRVEGRNNLYALAIARVCHFGGPDEGMSATGGDGREERGHLSTLLYDKGVLPASAAQDTEFRMSRVWSPEHGVQLEMQIQEHPADGPGHALPVLMSFHHQLGHEIARMIEDHPGQLEYWSGE